MSDYRENIDYPVNSDPVWSIYEEYYDKYFFNYAGDRTSLIPRKLHQVWVGSPFPDKYKRLAQTWIDKHPEWEYKLWTDSDVDGFGLVNKELFDRMPNNGARADIFRYEIIYRYGGVYADIDFECIKPLDDLLYLDFFAGNGYNGTTEIFNGLFASRPLNPIFQNIIENITPPASSSYNRYEEVLNITGTRLFTKSVLNGMTNTSDKMVIFPKNFFYPFPPLLRHTVREDTEQVRQMTYSYIKPRTYCIHLWYTSWQN